MNKQEMLNLVKHQGPIKFRDIRPGDTVLWFRLGQATISEVQRMIGRDRYWVNTKGNPINPEGREFYLVHRPAPDLAELPLYSVIRFKNHLGTPAVGMKGVRDEWIIIDMDGQRYHGTSHEIMKHQPRYLEVMN